MDKAQRERAAQIFADAVALAPAAREDFIAVECGGDAGMIAEVRALLAAGSDAEAYFSSLARRLGAAVTADDGEAAGVGAAGRVVGAYELREQVGSGGMGTVWRARRADGQYEADVAIKILNPSAAASAALGRLGDEARNLAKLSHPNIARLIDAGVVDERFPYLVLEYVEGSSIDRYCDARRLGVRARIGLFLGVLDAVAHAHAHLIVHRDLKPSNVLVTHDGQVKLLDFGISRLLEGPGRAQGEDDTGEQLAVTPDYAAPEQFARESITTATDVYALGLVMYKLLTGSNPRRTGGITSLAELQREVTRSAPPLIETITSAHSSPDRLEKLAIDRDLSPSRLLRTLRGELDDIVHRALAVDASARYADAREFAADLRRFLRRQPVLAHPDSIRYRARKFVQRHRGGVLSAMLTMILLIAAGVITILQSIEAHRQRDVAIYQQQRTQASYEFLTYLLGDLGPSGEPLSVQELLDRGVELIDRQFGDDDPFVAQTLHDISILYATIGQIDKQRALLDRAETIARSQNDGAMLATLLCARSRMLHVADQEAARADLAEAQAIMAETGRDASDPMACYRAQGLLHATDGNHAQAIDMFELALRVIDADPAASVNSRLILQNDLAEQYMKTGRAGDALGMLDQIIEAGERIGRGDTVGQIILLANRGTVLANLGEVASAAESYREAYTHVQTMEKPFIGVGVVYGSNLEKQGKFREALDVLEPEYRAARASDNARWLAQAALYIGLAHHGNGDSDAALPYLEQARAFLEETPAAHRRQLMRIREFEVLRALDAGDVGEAQRIVTQMLTALGYPDSEATPGLPRALIVASATALQSGDPGRALPLANAAIAAATDLARDADLSAYVGEAYRQRALVYRDLGRDAEARADLQQAITSLQNGYGDEHESLRDVRDLLQQADTGIEQLDQDG